MLALGVDMGGTRVKAALLRDGQSIALYASRRYRNPRPQQLLDDVAECGEALRAQAADDQVEAIGLCVPGVLNDQRTQVVYSANLPAIQEIELAQIAASAVRQLGAGAKRGLAPTVVTDQIAAATDYVVLRTVRGRLLSISIGAGVGAAVLDCDDEDPLGRPLRVSGESPGHIGQMDVSWDSDPPVGADGGAGSLEAYVGAAALRGHDPATLSIDDPPARALVRALRICHAIYRPDEIVLLGGVGTRLAHLREPLRQRVGQRLSKIARQGWSLEFGVDDYHAARGTARLALHARGD